MSIVVEFGPESLSGIEANIPEGTCIDFGTVLAPVLAFDSTTEEYANGELVAPADIDSAGTVTFRVACSPKTGAASKNVGWTFGHRAVATSEAIDGSLTDEDSGAKSITATTGNQTVMEWTETVTNLGWVAGDTVYFRLSRDTSVANNLAGDCYFLWLQVDIPTA